MAVVINSERPYDYAMKSSWREELHQALDRAQKHGYTLRRIAGELGIKVGKLYSFNTKGSLDADDLRALEDWLVGHGFYEHSQPGVVKRALTNPASADDNVEQVAATLHNASSMIANRRISMRERVELLRSNLDLLRKMADILDSIAESEGPADDTEG